MIFNIKNIKRKAFFEKGNIEHILTHYRDAFIEWYPEYESVRL